jgi:hypothetical protein
MADLLKGREDGMAIQRREFLKIGVGSAVAALAGSSGTQALAIRTESCAWHPLTWSLIRRAQAACSRPPNIDTPQIEQLIAETSAAQGSAKPPVIKWLPDPFSAYAHLNDYGLEKLLKMGSATLWSRAALPQRVDDGSLEITRCVRLEVVWDIIGAEEHDRVLMAPELLAKSATVARGLSAEEAFKVRAIAAQIGWLETSLPAAAALAVDAIDFLVTSGIPEDDELVKHNLRIFRAYELGLLATWETPAAFICIPRADLIS